MNHNIAIIAAGGQGSRIGSDLPKQYQLLDGKPILLYTLEAFSGIADKIILVIDPKMAEFWKELCREYQCMLEHEVVFGGKSRFESVRNGLHYIEQHYNNLTSKNTAIAVHDAARPLISRDLIRQSFTLCHQGFGNVLGIKSMNSVRIGSDKSSHAIEREKVWLMQTPQTFPADTLIQAFMQEEHESFTDEASVVEKLGYNVVILESNPTNIKITYQEDFAIAQAYIRKLH
ncbi:MAG TPA: 2-C-methyl-D-erythritol 4-phosphate cytidylyltransferase [Sphingobacterium sp.]|nr:2-C-methyl-D-erythritol 4-phosphate cytidylyltransferase [Sphingobacterium sp.]